MTRTSPRIRALTDISELLFYAGFLALFAKFAWLGLSPTDASDLLGVMLAAGIVLILSLLTARSDLFAITLSALSLLPAYSNYPLLGLVGFALIGGAFGGVISAVLTRLRSALEGRISPRSNFSRTALVQRIAGYTTASVVGFAQTLGAKLDPLPTIVLLSATAIVPLLLSPRLDRRER